MIDLTAVQQKFYDDLLLLFNGAMDDCDCNNCIAQLDDLIDEMKPKHFQIGDTVYYYNMQKNQIEKFVVESIAISNSHIVYNYIYEDSYVCEFMSETQKLAVKLIHQQMDLKIKAIGGEIYAKKKE